MRFGSWMLSGVLRDAAGEGEGGGGVAVPPPLDMKALAALIATTVKATFDERDKAAKTAAEADAAKKATEEAERKAAEDAAKGGDDGKGGGGTGGGAGEKDAATRLLENEVKKMQAELKKERDARAAEAKQNAEREKASGIRQALDKFDYVKPSGKETAYRHVERDVKVIDGKLLGPDDTPLDVWLKALFEEDLDTLIAPKAAGGSGATGARASGGGAAADIDDIKAGGKKLEAARERIAELAREALARR